MVHNKSSEDFSKIKNFEILSEEECDSVVGGNALTDLGKTPWGKIGLALCRKDVRDALNDEEFTSKLLKANKSDIRGLFAQRGVSVSDTEVNFCYDKILNKIKK